MRANQIMCYKLSVGQNNLSNLNFILRNDIHYCLTSYASLHVFREFGDSKGLSNQRTCVPFLGYAKQSDIETNCKIEYSNSCKQLFE